MIIFFVPVTPLSWSLTFEARTMKHFPAFIDIKDRRILVVGGGNVALRKVKLALEAGGLATVHSPDISADIQALADIPANSGRVLIVSGKFDPELLVELLDHHWFVIAATDDQQCNAEIARMAKLKLRLCNVVDDAETSSFIVPAIVDRSPVTVAISTAGYSPVLARMVKSRIESLLPTRLGELAEFAGSWRARIKARFASVRARHRFWQEVLDGEVADHLLGNRPTEAERALQHRLDYSSPETTNLTGKACLVGAGPGDPKLITVRGKELLERADVVLYDRLASAELLQLARRDAEFIDVGKSPNGPSRSQEDINALLVNAVIQGKQVCRLKGGDPFLFGRGGEELEALAEQGLPFEVVPGITAATGCAAYAGIPLTVRGLSRSVTLVTARGCDGETTIDWHSLAQTSQTLVFYMGVHQYAEISRRLIAAGLDGQLSCAIVSEGTTNQQRVIRTRLHKIHEGTVPVIQRPAVLIVGEVTALTGRYAWFAPHRFILDGEELDSGATNLINESPVEQEHHVQNAA